MDFISLQLVQCEKNLVTQGYRTKSYDFILNLRERLSWCLPALLADEGKTQRDNPRANVLGSGPDQRRWHALKCNLALGWPRACDHANLSSSAWPHLVPERMCGRPPGAGKRTSLNWRAERARLASPHHFQMQRGPASQLPDGVTLWHLCNRSKRASRPFSSLVMPSSWLARWIMVLLLPKEAVPRSKTPLTLPDTDPSCFSVLVACTWAAAQSRGGHTARGHQSGERQSAWAAQCTETQKWMVPPYGTIYGASDGLCHLQFEAHAKRSAVPWTHGGNTRKAWTLWSGKRFLTWKPGNSERVMICQWR